MSSPEGGSEAHASQGWFGTVTAVLSAIGTAWIFVVMLVILVDIFGRALFNAPLLGVPEMVQFSIVGIVFLQLPRTLGTDGLTRSDVLLGRLMTTSPRAGSWLQVVFNLIGMALFVVIFHTTWPLMLDAFANNEFYGATGVFELPTGPLKVIILIGTGAMALQFLMFIWRDLRVALGLAAPVPFQQGAE